MIEHIDAETSALGSAMLGRADILDLLNPDDFASTKLAVVCRAGKRLRKAKAGIDLATLRAELATTGHLEQVGGIGGLAELVEAVPTSANADHFARVVREQAMSRAMRRVDWPGIARHHDDPLEAVAEFRQNLEVIEGRRVSTNLHDGEWLANDARERLEEVFLNGREFRGISTGLQKLDEILSGLQKGLLYLVAGRPGTGKSSLLRAFLWDVAMRQKKRCLLFTLEMTKEEVTDALVCSSASIDTMDFGRGNISQDLFEGSIHDALSEITDSGLVVEDSSTLSINDIRGLAFREHNKKPLELVAVDYAQLIRANDRSGNREAQQAEVSRELKALAKDLGVPVVAAAQLNRGVEGRSDKRPLLADLRESGQYEQDANVVIMLYNEGARPTDAHGQVTEVLVRKHRGGRCGAVCLRWLPSFTRFEHLDRELWPEEGQSDSGAGF